MDPVPSVCTRVTVRRAGSTIDPAAEAGDGVRARRYQVIGAFALALAPTAMASAASPGDGDEVLVSDIGPGWSLAECPPMEDLGGAIACFEPDSGSSQDWLTISATPLPTDVDPGVYFETIAASLGGDPFETPGLDLADGRVIQAGGQTVLIVMVAGDHVFNLVLVSSAPRADAETLLLEVARRQQDKVGRPGGVSDSGATSHQLDRLLIVPPRGSGLEITATGNLQLDVEDLRPQARSQAVVDLLSNVPSRVRILSSGGVPAVLVTLEEYPYAVFAATALGSIADQPPDRLFSLDTARLQDAVGFRHPVEGGYGLGIALRKGRYLALLVTPPVGPDGDAVAELAELATLQADLLPEGETAPYFFPSAATSIAVTVGLATAICGAALGVGRLAAARGRRRTRPRNSRNNTASVEPYQVVDVARSARALRRRGLVLAVVDLAAVNVLVVGTLGVTGVLQLPIVLALMLLAAGALAGILFTAWWARSELRRTRGGDAFARELRPSVPGVIGGVVALALLVLGLALVASGLAGLAFGPSLSGLERSRRFGVDPALLNLAALVAGVVLLILGGFAVRLARIWARGSAQRVRARDRRPPILYLRSFEDDALKLPAVVSARRPFLELFAARGSDPFEESIAWQVAPYGPVVAIGRPGRSLQSLGAARDHLPDDVWRERVSELMTAARAIVVIIGSTEGLRWEVAQLVSGGHLDVTVFVFPPATADVVRDRWRFTTEALSASGVRVQDLPAATERILATVRDRSGVWRVTVADLRDEATFRAGLDQAMEWITERRGKGITDPVSVAGGSANLSGRSMPTG
jgi:hypothetical protein